MQTDICVIDRKLSVEFVDETKRYYASSIP